MKRLLVIAIALISIQGIAQGERKERPNKQERAQRMDNFTPEEAATLQTKKMTLHLDLSEKQQKDIYQINIENASQRKAMMETRKANKESGSIEKPSKERRLKMMNAKLDHQIAMKTKMKTILNSEQYTKWVKVQERMGHREKSMKKGEGQKHRERRPKQD